MNWLIDKIGIDRITHALVCWLISENMAFIWFFGILSNNGWITRIGAAFIGAFIAYLVGWAKEWYDSHQPNNHADGGDLIADIVGAILGAITFILVLAVII